MTSWRQPPLVRMSVPQASDRAGSTLPPARDVAAKPAPAAGSGREAEGGVASPPCLRSPPGPQELAGRLPRLRAVRRMDGSWAERSTTPLHLEPEWTAAPLLWDHHGDDDAKSGCVLGPLCADSRGPGSRWSWSPVSLAPTAALPARSAPARAAPCSLPLGLASCSSYGGR